MLMSKFDNSIVHLLPSDPEKLLRMADGMIDIHKATIKQLQGFKDEIAAQFPGAIKRRKFSNVILGPDGEEEAMS